MTPSLFDLKNQYGTEFEQVWERYGYKLDKDDAATAWRQTATIRPQIELLLLCIDEYKCRIKKTKTKQKYLAGWLRKKRWDDDMIEARHRLANPKPADRVLKPFRASDYGPALNPPTRTAAQILAEYRAKNGA